MSSVHGERLLDVFEALPANIATVDHQGTITAVNAAWRQIAVDNGGDESLCGVGINYLAICDAAHGNDREDAMRVGRGIRAVLAGHIREFSHDYPWNFGQHADWFRVSVRRITNGAVIMHVRITGLRHARDVARDITGNDAVSDMVPHARFEFELERCFTRAEADGRPIGMISLKIRDFKSIERRDGHHAADAFIQELANRIRARCRHDDLLARMADDEFAIVSANSDCADHMMLLAEDVRQEIQKPVLIGDDPVRPRVGLGVALASQAWSDPGELADLAEQAMQVAFSRGSGISCIDRERFETRQVA